MELIKDKWNKKDIKEFNDYLYSIRNEEKINWTKNVIRTNLNTLAIKNPILKEITKEIAKGNYSNFLDNIEIKYYENTIINAFLINKIKDFNIQKKYLDEFVQIADCWATTDAISVNTKGKEKEYLNLAKVYINSSKTFVKRIGINILFKLIDTKAYLQEIFNILDSFYTEEEYYVNMINAWLVCECFIKHRDETLEYLKQNNLNKFTINKAISKCRDSYRVSKEDKELLLKYKK